MFYMSRETNNVLLATLSAGPVGTGDAMGAENKANLFQAVRADGVIVNPTRPSCRWTAAISPTRSKSRRR